MEIFRFIKGDYPFVQLKSTSQVLKQNHSKSLILLLTLRAKRATFISNILGAKIRILIGFRPMTEFDETFFFSNSTQKE